MELLLVIIASISSIVAGYFADGYYAEKRKARVAVTSLGTVTNQLSNVNRTKDMLSKMINELTTKSINLSNELNIAIGRLEHLDHILKTKTNANKCANAQLYKTIDTLDALKNRNDNTEGLLTIKAAKIVNLRKQLKEAREITYDLRNELRRVKSATPRGDF